MKRFALLLALAGSAVAGFLLWKRKEVNRASEISQDPWPSAVAETHSVVPPITPKIETSVDSTGEQGIKPVKKPVRKRAKKVPDVSSD
jgi:hypothetical protein